MNSRHFVAIVVRATMKEKKLLFPSPFAERYGGELSDIVSISVPDGRKWNLGVGKSGTSVWLDNGWSEFAEFYSIGHANALFFKYKDASCFDVHVFDKTACEIDYACIQDTEVDRSVVVLSEEEDDSSVEISGSSPCHQSSSHRENLVSQDKRSRVAATKSKNVLQKEPGRSKLTTEGVAFVAVDDDGGDLGPGQARKGKSKLKDDQLREDARPVPVIDSHETYLRALEEAENPIQAAKTFKTAGHSFIRIIQSYHLTGRGGYIPSEFAGRLKYSKKFVDLQIQVSDGTVYGVRAVERANSRLNLATGFYHFVTDNHLEEGDVVVFELIDPESAKLKAWIFHASSFPHGQGLTRNQGTGYSMERPSSSVVKKKKAEKPLGKASVSDEPEEGEGRRKVYHSVKFKWAVARASQGTKRARNAALELKSENPSVVLLVQPSTLYKKRLYMPTEFCDLYLSRDSKDIEVQDSDGRKWLFQSVPESRGGLYLTEGWIKFAADNDLEAGDVCLFEMIKSEKVVLKVSVFHASLV